MSQRNRSDRLALVALAIIVAGAVLAAFFGLVEQAQRQTYREPTNSAASNEYRDSKEWWEDTLPQWLMAVFAVTATGVGVWTILLLRDTLAATRKGNKITRNSAERQLRAYVDVRPGGVKDADGPGDAMGFVSIINVGHIPATDVRTLVKISIGAKGRSSFDQADATNTIGSLQPGAEIRQGSEPDRWPNLEVDNEFIFVFGVVKYIDGFNRERITKFCHRYRCADIVVSWSEATYSYRKEAGEARQHHTGNEVT